MKNHKFEEIRKRTPQKTLDIVDNIFSKLDKRLNMKQEKFDNIDYTIMVCNCDSIEHQMAFTHNKEDNEFYCEIHLTNYENFFKRLWIGLKYAFGYKCVYGNWDSFIFKESDLSKLRSYLNEIK